MRLPSGDVFTKILPSNVHTLNNKPSLRISFAFLFIKTETEMSKREKPKTVVDTKTEKPGILSGKT